MKWGLHHLMQALPFPQVLRRHDMTMILMTAALIPASLMVLRLVMPEPKRVPVRARARR